MYMYFLIEWFRDLQFFFVETFFFVCCRCWLFVDRKRKKENKKRNLTDICRKIYQILVKKNENINETQ